MKDWDSIWPKTQNALRVRLPREDEITWFDMQLAHHHCIGPGRFLGDDLRHVVESDGRAVALLVWSSSCNIIQERDRGIGWSALQRVERLEFVKASNWEPWAPTRTIASISPISTSPTNA